MRPPRMWTRTGATATHNRRDGRNDQSRWNELGVMTATREESVAYFAESIRKGKSARNTRFGWFENGDSRNPKVDITDDVLAAAGPETPEEVEARKVEDESRFADRLGSQIETDITDDFGWSSSSIYCRGHKLAVDGDEESRLILLREDGKRYEVEVTVYVSEVTS